MDRIEIELDAWESVPCPIYTGNITKDDLEKAERELYYIMCQYYRWNKKDVDRLLKGIGESDEINDFKDAVFEEEEKLVMDYGGVYYEDMIECVVCPDCGETMIVQHDIDNYRCLKCQNVFQM